MNLTPKQLERLYIMLRDLMLAQDNVTHMNGRGIEYAAETQQRIADRNGVRAEIISYVDSLLAQQ